MRILGVISAESLQTVISLGFVFFVALGIGANDIPHIFGPIVASRTLSVSKSLVFASTFETIGIFLLGNHVLDSRTEILRFPNSTAIGSIEIMYAETSTLLGCAFWIILASTVKMPVSATLSMIGSSIGTALVIGGQLTLTLRDIIWLLISPFLAAILSVLFHLIVDYVWKMSNGHKSSQITAMVLFGISTSLFLFSLTGCLPTVARLDLPWYLCLLISVVSTAGALFGFYKKTTRTESRNPRMSKDEQEAVELVAIQTLANRRNSAECNPEWRRSVRAASIVVAPRPSTAVLQTRHVYSVLQTITTCLEALIHGSFAYSNVALSVSTTYSIYTSNWPPHQMNMLWIGSLILVSVGIVTGILAISYRVFNTITEKLPIPVKPLSIQVANLIIMLLSLKFGLPMSTTVCKLLSVFAVGAYLPSFSWGPLKRIAVAWILTIPLTALISAGVLKSLLFLQRIR